MQRLDDDVNWREIERGSSAIISPAQCLHPGVVVDLADSDDEDCQFHCLQEPVTTACVCRVSSPQSACLQGGKSACGFFAFLHWQSPSCFSDFTAVWIFFSFGLIWHNKKKSDNWLICIVNLFDFAFLLFFRRLPAVFWRVWRRTWMVWRMWRVERRGEIF